MCTVTLIQHNDSIILTSSRDEKESRPTLALASYSLHEQNIYFPKDELAGGTWVAYSDKKRAACLLNGAFTKHERKSFYSVSRGKILLNSFSAEIDEYVESCELKDVEPFTLLMMDFNTSTRVSELIWDGENKHVTHLHPFMPKIWSSTTLYTREVIEERKEWFETLLLNKHTPNSTDMWTFHSGQHTDDAENNIVMKRAGGLKTVSITQLISSANETSISYKELQSGIVTTKFPHG